MNKVILLVEDNPTDEKLTIRAFQKCNITNQIVVVRDGLEVLRRIRADQRTSVLPVVVLTASKEDEDVARSYSLGANAYVRKPVDFTEFAEAVKTLGLFWLLLNEPAQRRGTP